MLELKLPVAISRVISPGLTLHRGSMHMSHLMSSVSADIQRVIHHLICSWSLQATTEIPLVLVCRAPSCPNMLCASCMPLLIIALFLHHVGTEKTPENHLWLYCLNTPVSQSYPANLASPRLFPTLG